MKRELRLKDETIQQREIDISCLRGQVIALQRLYNPEQLKCDINEVLGILNTEDDDDDSDTLTNIEPISEEDILLEDLDFDDDELIKLQIPPIIKISRISQE